MRRPSRNLLKPKETRMNYPASSQIEAKDRNAARERRCVVSGEVLPEAQLIRFALGPDDVLAPDVAAKLPGRGAWVRADRASIELAAKKNGFAHALKAKAKAPDGLADLTETLLAKRCLDLIGMARRAGAIAFGATASGAGDSRKAGVSADRSKRRRRGGSRKADGPPYRALGSPAGCNWLLFSGGIGRGAGAGTCDTRMPASRALGGGFGD